MTAIEWHNIIHLVGATFSTYLAAWIYRIKKSKAPIYIFITIDQQMKNYLQKNWKHLTAALLVIVMQILNGSGVITPAEANIVSLILGALGLASTTNSGTTQPPAAEN